MFRVFASTLCATNPKATMNSQDHPPTTSEGGAVHDGPRHDAERVSKSKRTLLKAGWVVPVIGAISLPASGYYKCGSNCQQDPD